MHQFPDWTWFHQQLFSLIFDMKFGFNYIFITFHNFPYHALIEIDKNQRFDRRCRCCCPFSLLFLLKNTRIAINFNSNRNLNSTGWLPAIFHMMLFLKKLENRRPDSRRRRQQDAAASFCGHFGAAPGAIGWRNHHRSARVAVPNCTEHTSGIRSFSLRLLGMLERSADSYRIFLWAFRNVVRNLILPLGWMTMSPPPAAAAISQRCLFYNLLLLRRVRRRRHFLPLQI